MSAVGWRITLRLAGAVYFVVCSVFCLPLIPAPSTNKKGPDLKSKDGGSPHKDIAGSYKDTSTASDDVDAKQKMKTLQVVSVDGANVECKVSMVTERMTEGDELSTSSSVNSLKSFIRLKVTWLAAFAFFFSALAQTFHAINFVSVFLLKLQYIYSTKLN